MKTHPVCKLFPDMSEDQFKELVKDIEENGQLEPILTYKDRIVDGRHRFKACKMLGIEPRMEEWNGEGSLVKFVVSRNLHRRHLSTSQKAMIASDMLPLLEKEAELRKLKPLKEHAKKIKGGKQSDDTSTSPKNKEEHKKRAAGEAAKSVGVSRAQVQKAKALKKKAPELAEKVKKGEMTANAAKKLADATPEERKKALAKAKKIDPKTGKKVGVKKAIKDLKPAKKPAREVNESKLLANIERVVKGLEIVGEKLGEVAAAAKLLKALPLKRTSVVKKGLSLSEKIAARFASLVAE
jgi:hypothetical protein